MATRGIGALIEIEKTILVRSRAKHWWEVAMTGVEKPHRFVDRRLAVSYAKMWAAANRPSTVRVMTPDGQLEREWNFR